jgi:cytochrome c1
LSIVAIVAAGLITGCTGGQSARPYSLAEGGDPGGGRQVIVKYGCGRCHTIPGIPRANGVFGPPLNFMGRRTMIAGNFPNDPDNLVRWIMAPQSMKPKTAMPPLGLTEREARDAAAYLYTLR